MFLPCFLKCLYCLERHQITFHHLLCYLTYWISFSIFFVPFFCNWSGECVCVSRAKLLWPRLLTQTVYPYSKWEIIEHIVWIAWGRWVSQWTEMSTRTCASLNRIQTIKPVSHQYCHCRQTNYLLFFRDLSKFHFFEKKRGHISGNAGQRKRLEDAELLLILESLETSPTPTMLGCPYRIQSDNPKVAVGAEAPSLPSGHNLASQTRWSSATLLWGFWVSVASSYLCCMIFVLNY